MRLTQGDYRRGRLCLPAGAARLERMNRPYVTFLLACLFLAALACGPISACRAPAGPVAAEVVPAGDTATVTRIIDGDTIEVSLNDRAYPVRYIGMDTPERGDFFYAEASAANRALVEAQTVILVKDVSETDRYGRLLRYVYLPDGTFVNAELVAQGYAVAVTFPPDVREQELFRTLEREARENGRGLWADETAVGEPATGVRLLSTPAASPAGPSNCDPAYPTVCIPSPPPDLNCGNIAYRDFGALPADPHHFDGDNDGVGCES